MSRWPRVRIGAIKADSRHALVGGPFGSELTTRDYVEDGVPVIRGANLPLDRTFEDDGFVFVREEKADQLIANTARPGDVVFTQRGTLGQVGLIPTDARFPRYVISQSQMRLTVDGRRANARFVYYWFRCAETVQTIKNHALTSGVPHINLGILRDLELPLPHTSVQDAIAGILSAYDDLIENNRRRMVLLEDAAQQLYREWFVRLRFPGHEHTRIVDGVPKGWERRPLGGCVTFVSGGTPSKARAEYWDGEIPWVSSGEMATTRLYDATLHVTAEAAADGSRLAPADTVLVVVRGMSLAKEFRVAITRRQLAFNQDLKALACKPDVVPQFLFHVLLARREHIRDLATEASHGTKKLETSVLASLPTLVPPLRLQRQFQGVTSTLNSQQDNLYQQSRKLRIARDILLPRLMSGEITV